MSIKEIREFTELTKREFSETTGIPLRTLEDWEADRRNPPKYVLYMLEHIFVKNFGKGWDIRSFE